jgi:hypothetical protein
VRFHKNSHPKTLNHTPRRKITKLSKATLTKNSGVNCMDECNVMQNTKSTTIGHHVGQLSKF